MITTAIIGNGTERGSAMNNERFLAIYSSIVPNENGCLIWPATSKISSRHAPRAYTQSHTLFNGGTTPEKPFILHSCGNGRCVNHLHLRSGTHGENMADALSHGTLYICKLNREQILEVRSLYDLGVNPREIADKFQVNKKTVCRIGRRKSWKELV